MIETKTIFYGDKISEFKSIELQAFITCFACGVQQGPFPIKKPPFPYKPIFDCKEKDQLGRDANFLKAVLAGNLNEDNPIIEWVCSPCVLKNGFQVLDD